jgi:hypothetical protein
LRADTDRAAGPRRFAAAFAWRESAVFDAAARPSRLSAEDVAFERVRDTACFADLAFAESFAAFRRVSALLPLPGAFNATPARRAFDRPIAIACFAERAPCLPSRT